MERVIGEDNLLEEILLRIPAKIVHGFIPVSKRWCSLISSLRFRRRHGTFHLHHPASSSEILMFDRKEGSSVITLLDIDNGVIKITNVESGKLLLSSIQPYYDKLRQKIDESKEVIDFRICDAYNGLFLISLKIQKKETKISEFSQGELYCLVCNSLTKEYQELPLLSNHKSSSFTALAFAPSKCNGYYKIVISYYNQDPDGDYAVYIVQVYSSQTRTWKDSGHLMHEELYDSKYVVWDNCLLLVPKGNWWGSVVVLDADRLCVTKSSSLLPSFIEKDEKDHDYSITYVGEFGGILYAILKDDSDGEGNKYKMWEMKGIDGSWKEKLQFNTEKDFTILHIHREDEHVWLLMWDHSTYKVYYCLDGVTECLQKVGDVQGYWNWNIRYHTPTLFPLVEQ